MKHNFAFGGVQRSYSFDQFHGDFVSNSQIGVPCPSVECVLVVVQNDPDSTGNVIFGGERLGVVGTGIELEPSEFSAWIMVNNLSQIWHKEADNTTYMRYYIIGNQPPEGHVHLLQEDRSHLLLEDGGRILL